MKQQEPVAIVIVRDGVIVGGENLELQDGKHDLFASLSVSAETKPVTNSNHVEALKKFDSRPFEPKAYTEHVWFKRGWDSAFTNAATPAQSIADTAEAKLVPIEPTWEMIAKGSLLALGRNMNEATVRRVWAGMLSVAPSATPPAPSVADTAGAKPIRDAVGVVLEGFTLPHAVRKILETAYFVTHPAPSVADDPLLEKLKADRYQDKTIACSSCGLTMGESRELAAIAIAKGMK